MYQKTRDNIHNKSSFVYGSNDESDEMPNEEKFPTFGGPPPNLPVFINCDIIKGARVCKRIEIKWNQSAAFWVEKKFFYNNLHTFCTKTQYKNMFKFAMKYEK